MSLEEDKIIGTIFGSEVVRSYDHRRVCFRYRTRIRLDHLEYLDVEAVATRAFMESVDVAPAVVDRIMAERLMKKAAYEIEARDEAERVWQEAAEREDRHRYQQISATRYSTTSNYPVQNFTVDDKLFVKNGESFHFYFNYQEGA